MCAPERHTALSPHPLFVKRLAILADEKKAQRSNQVYTEIAEYILNSPFSREDERCASKYEEMRRVLDNPPDDTDEKWEKIRKIAKSILNIICPIKAESRGKTRQAPRSVEDDSSIPAKYETSAIEAIHKGELRAARRYIFGIKNDQIRERLDPLICKQAQQAGERGDIEEAIGLAELVFSDKKRNQLFKKIEEWTRIECERIHKRPAAHDVTRTVGDPNKSHEQGIAATARDLIKRGKTDEACKLINGITDEGLKTQLTMEATRPLPVSRGETRQALRSVKEYCSLIDHHINNGSAEELDKILQEILPPQDERAVQDYVTVLKHGLACSIGSQDYFEVVIEFAMRGNLIFEVTQYIENEVHNTAKASTFCDFIAILIFKMPREKLPQWITREIPSDILSQVFSPVFLRILQNKKIETAEKIDRLSVLMSTVNADAHSLLDETVNSLPLDTSELSTYQHIKRKFSVPKDGAQTANPDDDKASLAIQALHNGNFEDAQQYLSRIKDSQVREGLDPLICKQAQQARVKGKTEEARGLAELVFSDERRGRLLEEIEKYHQRNAAHDIMKGDAENAALARSLIAGNNIGEAFSVIDYIEDAGLKMQLTKEATSAPPVSRGETRQAPRSVEEYCSLIDAHINDGSAQTLGEILQEIPPPQGEKAVQDYKKILEYGLACSSYLQAYLEVMIDFAIRGKLIHEVRSYVAKVPKADQFNTICDSTAIIIFKIPREFLLQWITDEIPNPMLIQIFSAVFLRILKNKKIETAEKIDRLSVFMNAVNADSHADLDALINSLDESSLDERERSTYQHIKSKFRLPKGGAQTENFDDAKEDLAIQALHNGNLEEARQYLSRIKSRQVREGVDPLIRDLARQAYDRNEIEQARGFAALVFSDEKRELLFQEIAVSDRGKRERRQGVAAHNVISTAEDPKVKEGVEQGIVGLARFHIKKGDIDNAFIFIDMIKDEKQKAQLTMEATSSLPISREETRQAPRSVEEYCSLIDHHINNGSANTLGEILQEMPPPQDARTVQDYEKVFKKAMNDIVEKVPEADQFSVLCDVIAVMAFKLPCEQFPQWINTIPESIALHVFPTVFVKVLKSKKAEKIEIFNALMSAVSPDIRASLDATINSLPLNESERSIYQIIKNKLSLHKGGVNTENLDEVYGDLAMIAIRKGDELEIAPGYISKIKNDVVRKSLERRLPRTIKSEDHVIGVRLVQACGRGDVEEALGLVERVVDNEKRNYYLDLINDTLARQAFRNGKLQDAKIYVIRIKDNIIRQLLDNLICKHILQACNGGKMEDARDLAELVFNDERRASLLADIQRTAARDTMNAQVATRDTMNAQVARNLIERGAKKEALQFINLITNEELQDTLYAKVARHLIERGAKKEALEEVINLIRNEELQTLLVIEATNSW